MQKCTFSVKDFVVINNLLEREIEKIKDSAPFNYLIEGKQESLNEKKERLKKDSHYQDLLRFQKHINALDFDVKLPKIKVEE